MKRQQTITVRGSKPPVVEIDTETQSAYVRFSEKKVARTIAQDGAGPVITIDLDDGGQPVGVEIVGVQEFSIKTLLFNVRVSVDPGLLEKAKYVAARKRESMAAA